MHASHPIPLGASRDDWQGPAVLASGHRPFFLLTGLYGAASVGLWLLALRGVLPATMAWHGHEMVFGFAAAAIAGFLLAAVPKWTQRGPYRGLPVGVLVALWLAGRVGMAAGTAALDLLFLPALAVVVGRDIVRTRNHWNYQVIGVLAGLTGLNLLFHLGHPSLALRAAVYVVTLLVALIAGRVVPMFTRNALRLAGHAEADCSTPPWLDRVAVPVLALLAVTELLAPGSVAAGAIAGVAGVFLLLRMRRWRTLQTLGLPIVWVLHAGALFLPMGLLLKAAADLGGWVSPLAALHALTAGGIGVMILAVASRAALGHSGRPLQPARATVGAYGLVIAGALLRVTAVDMRLVMAAGVLWAAGFAVFSVVYWPILTQPRVDGHPG